MALPDWVIGVLLSVVGAFMDNLGVTLQKSSHMLRGGEAGAAEAGARPYYREGRWLAGFAVFLLGNGLNAVGLGFAPQTLFAAIGGVTLVANAFNSRFLLGEPLTGRVLAGTAVIIAGSVLAVLFGKHPDENFTLDDLEHFLSLEFYVYLGVVFALLGALAAAIHQTRARSAAFEAAHAGCLAAEEGTLPRPSPPGTPTRVQAGPALPASPAALAAHERRGVFLSVAIPSFAGLIGSLTVLLAKCVAELARVSFEGDNQFDQWPPYALVLAVCASGFLQVHWLNVGLRGYNQIVVVPSFLAVYTTFSILGGIFFFREASGFTTTEKVLFPGGTALSFFGVLVIATRPDQLHENVTGGLLAPEAPPAVLSRTTSLEEATGGGGAAAAAMDTPLLAAGTDSYGAAA